MKEIYLDENWQVKTNTVNYWQILSYLLFIAFIFTAFSWSVINQKLYGRERDAIYLKVENTHLKQEIDSVNGRIKKEFGLTERVINKSKKIKL